jgi:hypothetical protein
MKSSFLTFHPSGLIPFPFGLARSLFSAFFFSVFSFKKYVKEKRKKDADNKNSSLKIEEMRIVVDKHAVAHLWANQEQNHARTPSGNLYFNSNGIFSYGSHFLIAKHVENGAGERAILMTKRTYSNTTNGQINIVRSAARHIQQILVPDPDQKQSDNFEKWYTEIRHIADKLVNARKPEKYVLLIEDVINEVNRYANFFSCEVPEYLLAAGEIKDNAQYTEVLQKETERRRLQEEKEQQERLKLLKIRLKEWRAFKTSYIKIHGSYDFLRFNKTTNRVETSQRVEIPAEIAKAFYNLVLETIAKGGCNNCDMMLMERYHVKEINKDFIKVGCHKITIKEIKALSKKLGWKHLWPGVKPFGLIKQHYEND